MNKCCIVFVCNKAYFNKFTYTCTQLLTNGKYTGDICLVIGDDLRNDALLDCNLIKNNNITIQYFPDIQFSQQWLESNNQINTDGRNISKRFQWHKLHLFNTVFKKWRYMFYIDCGMSIYSDVTPMLQECTENTLLAHSDAYPTYEWKLHTQFDTTKEQFAELNSKYNLNIDYFQTGIMLYDTNIIEDTTFAELLALACEYPISKTNEQGITALYFTNSKPYFKQIRTNNEYTYFYDSMRRRGCHNYIMVKWG